MIYIHHYSIIQSSFTVKKFSVLHSRPVMSDSLRLQCARPPCPSPSPKVCPSFISIVCPLSIHSSFPTNPRKLLIFCCLHSFSFSRIYYCWDNTIIFCRADFFFILMNQAYWLFLSWMVLYQKSYHHSQGHLDFLLCCLQRNL